MISGVSGTVRQCDPGENDVNKCESPDFDLKAVGNRKIYILSGRNIFCSCLDNLCNKSPWLEWAKPTTRRSTTESLQPTDQHDVAWYNPDIQTDSEEMPLSTDSEGVAQPINSEGIPLPTDSEGVPLVEEGMSTQSMDHTLPAGYNDHSTDKIQSNGIKALNDDMVFATLLTLEIYILWSD